MMKYYLGADVGATKTQVWIADQNGQVVGRGESGPGNHETVGYDGLRNALTQAIGQAANQAGITEEMIAGSGFGVAGYDWESEREATLQVIHSLGLTGPVEAVNDTILGLLAGASEGWGIALISGTGCNCRGWDATHRSEGRVVGRSTEAGEGAGSTELMAEVVKALCYEWTMRSGHTGLSSALIKFTGAANLADLLEGYFEGRYRLDGSLAPLVFDIARAGDPIAAEIIRRAGCELGEMTNAVIRQLHFEQLAFDVVLVGSMFSGGELLQAPMRQTICELAPGARFIWLSVPPVTGAVLLGMAAAGYRYKKDVRKILMSSI